MPIQVTYFENRDPARIPIGFRQTPIFIGTATQRVVVSKKPGVFSLAIPPEKTGCKFRDDLFDSQVKYWRIYGKGTISLIAPHRMSLEIGNSDLAFISSQKALSRCNIFIKVNNRIIFSSPIHSIEFAIINETCYITDCSLYEKLPVDISLVECIFASPTVVENVPYITHDNLVELLPLPDQLEATDFNTLIEANYVFYYDIIDYRWARLTIKDTLALEYQYNRYNKLGLAAVLHRRISDTDMTLFTVPDESIKSIEHVLSELELNPQKYGYAIVPLWMSDEMNNIIAQYVAGIERTQVGFQIAYLTRGLPTQKEYFEGGVYIPAVTNNLGFTTGYGLFFGNTYGQASD